MTAIADATEADLEAILAIHNDVVTTSTAIYSDRLSTLDERRDWFAERRAAGFPVLSARNDDGALVAFASYGPFRPWPGYANTVEHSVHVRADQRGGGLGTQLVRALIAHASAAGLHVMIAGIDGENTGSIRLHERLGFEHVGRLPEVARKFDRWVDLVLLQRSL